METSNNYYIIQEFCDSGDLQRTFKKSCPIEEKEAIKIWIDLLEGFIELVKKGIIHRDLKPANILKHKNIYKLADFGFAKCLSNFKREMLQSMVGTPLYMSPQILDN